MKMKFKLMVAAICLLTKVTFGQNGKKNDLYYLVDTSKIPAKDRILDYFVENRSVTYLIKCPCRNENYIFFSRQTKDTGYMLNQEKLEQIHFQNLPDLINKISKIKTNDFNDSYNLYFVEYDNNRYVKYKVFLADPFKRRGSIDVITVPKTP